MGDAQGLSAMAAEVDVAHTKRCFNFAAIYDVLLLLAVGADGCFLIGFFNLYHR